MAAEAYDWTETVMLSVRIPKGLFKQIDALAKKQGPSGVPRADVIRAILREGVSTQAVVRRRAQEAASELFS